MNKKQEKEPQETLLKSTLQLMAVIPQFAGASKFLLKNKQVNKQYFIIKKSKV